MSDGNLFRGWGRVALEKKLKTFLILTDFYKIIWYQEKLVRKYESVSGRYRPYRLCNVISLASVPNCKSCCKKLAFKEQWWPQGSPVKARSGADLADGLGPCSADEHSIVNYERDHRTTLVLRLLPVFPSWKWHIYVYLVNTDTHILGYFVSLLLCSWNGEIIRTFFAAMY